MNRLLSLASRESLFTARHSRQLRAVYSPLAHSPHDKVRPLTTETSSRQNPDQENEKKHKWLTVPNCITVTRMACTPYLSYLILQNEYKAALGFCFVAGASDWLDGYIARKYNAQSVVGSFLDPLADKLMISTLSLTLAYQGLLPVPLLAVMFGRDAALVAGTFYHRAQSRTKGASFFSTTDAASFQVEPTMLSKVNTLLQFGLMGFVLINGEWQILGEPMLNGLFAVVGATTVGSGLDYAKQYVDHHGVFSSVRKKP